MSINVNGTEIESVIVDSIEVDKVIADGVTVFEKSVEPIDPYNPVDCISFVGEDGDFTLTVTSPGWEGVVEYSTNASAWTAWDGMAITSVDSKLYLRGSGNTHICSDGHVLTLSAKAGCYGNIQTLLQYDDPPTSLTGIGCYQYMFYGCKTLTHAPKLPAMTLTSECYRSMFDGCTGLTQAPELPATTVVYQCYFCMFSGCTGLTQAPELPATTVESLCYYNMFYGCTGLTRAPELPATTVADGCYYEMFAGCTSIKLSTTQDSTYKTPYRIPTAGTGTTAEGALNDMFTNTGGTFTGTPEINTTYYGAWE